MKYIRLTEICTPKQWKTISISQLTDSGFPVYGANGKIGYYHEYNHEYSTLTITCRGATCGNVNLSEPKSYINGNAMALDNLSSNFYIKYLYYFLSNSDLKKTISGSAQPQITRTALKRVHVPQVSLQEQKQIANILDKADALRKKNKQLLTAYDELLQATFLDMFGDPVNNPKGWEKKRIGVIGKVVTGNTPPRVDSSNYGGYIEWIKTDNIRAELLHPTKAREMLSESGIKKGRMIPKNSILVTCIAGSLGSIGNCVLTDREVAFNQQINAIVPGNNNPLFLYFTIQYSKILIQDGATKGMKKIITKSNFEKLSIINPPIELQDQYAQIANNIEAQKTIIKQSIQENEDLFNGLVQKAFKGGLAKKA